MSTLNRTSDFRARGLFAGVVDRYNRYQLYRTTFGELDSLHDRELGDLGISRTSIRSIAYKAAYGG